jgi:hypothetical protein
VRGDARKGVPYRDPYTADLLGTKMKTMFPDFTGVLLAFSEE